MSETGRTSRIPPPSALATVLDCYERGQHVDALRRAQEIAPLREWSGIEACAIASRIALNTGAPHLASVLAVRAWRADRRHALAQLEYAFQLIQARGPFVLWRAMNLWPAPERGTAEEQAELLALKARVAADLRDFSGAEELQAQAESLAASTPWIRLQRAHILECMDRTEEALVVARAACELHRHPCYRPGVQTVAYLLQLLDRDEAAIALLKEANGCLQNAPIAAQLYALLSENQRWDEAEPVLEQHVNLSPLLETPGQRWVASQRARVAYHLGKRPEAAQFAAVLEDPFSRRFVEQLAAAPLASERVRLEVPFIRQHFKTCAPATMAALGRFWNMPAEHLTLVEAVCYDGTPHWQQRDWAEHNGWAVREFRVTWESSLELLGRGIPFAITTVEATSAHMQAVMGFDRTRDSLLLRDPFQPYAIEMPKDPFFERYRPFGPRGVIFLPMGKSNLLDGVSLPDCELYDEYHLLTLALSKHDRAAAVAAQDKLEARWPDHELTWEGRLNIAAYDANSVEEARCLDKLLERFPNAPGRVLRRLSSLRDASREERIEFLEAACAARPADPAVFVELARHLSADARQRARSEYWLRRALRARPMDSSVIGAVADAKWMDGGQVEATDYYRVAANIEGFRENLYQSWFIASRQTRQTEKALAHLEDRLRRFGRRSTQPALTLVWALCDVDQPEPARKVLAEATRLHGQDGYLALRAASLSARLGDFAEADRQHASAKGKVRENDWLRLAAEIAEWRLDAATSLKLFREILVLEPLAVDAHNGVARLLARLQGTQAALDHLRENCARFPHHCGLRRTLVEWSRRDGFESVARASRDFLALSPGDAWTRRELAWALFSLNRPEDALAEMHEAQRIEPRNSAGHTILAHVHSRLGRSAEARQHFHQAIESSVDNTHAINGLLALAVNDQERKEELSFVEQQLIQQVVRGDGLLLFSDLARPVLAPQSLLELLKRAQHERPDLWHVWSALTSQLDHLKRYDEALVIAKQAAERFSHLPRLWLDLSIIHRRRNESDAELAAAQRAFEINPAWTDAALFLAGALERQRTLAEAKKVYDRALQHLPLDPQLHAQRATIFWRLRQPKEALEAVERALRIEPDYHWAWDLLLSWSRAGNEPERAADFAQALTRERSGEARVWLRFARTMSGAPDRPERLAALDRALELDPRLLDAWDFKGDLLASSERFTEALEACERGLQTCAGDTFMLRGRKAWVEAQRGKLVEAIQEMRAVLTQNAGYAWGWFQLADWLVRQEAFVEAEGAVERLLQLRPHDPWALRQLASLRLRRGDRPGAQKVFSSVLEISPTDKYSAESLFDLQLETSELAGAAKTLQLLQTHQPGARTLARQVQLAVRRGEKAAALDSFAALCHQSDPDPWPVAGAFDSLKKSGLHRRALKILRRASRTSTGNPQTGPTAVEYLLWSSSTFAALRCFAKIRSPAGQQRAGPVLMKELGKTNRDWAFTFALWRWRELFKRDDATWGHVGYSLVHLKKMRAAAEWMADWRSRPAAEPWMLFNLCLALRHRGLFQPADEITRYVVEKWGHRQTSADLRLFLAVEEALAGNTAAAVAQLQQVHARDKVPYDQQLLALTRALVEFQQASPESRRAQFKAIRERLNRTFATQRMFGYSRDVRLTFRRAGKAFQRDGGGWPARLWFSWKLDWHWLLVLLVPLFAAALLQPRLLVGLFAAIVIVTIARRAGQVK